MTSANSISTRVTGVGAALEHAHAIIDEFKVLDEALVFAEILAQREIEGVDRTDPFGRRDRAFAIDLHLDDRLRDGDEIALRIVAPLDIDAKALDLEEIGNFAEHAARQQFEDASAPS